MFTIDSGLVRLWARRIDESKNTLEDVPNIGNLKEKVEERLKS